MLNGCDALIDIDGKLTVCDWKTSKEIRSDEMLLIIVINLERIIMH